MDEDIESTAWKLHHIRKALDRLNQAQRLLSGSVPQKAQLELLEALEDVALAYGIYVPTIGMMRYPGMKVAVVRDVV